MFEIIFYKDKKGREPVKDYIVSLKTKGSKNDLIKLNKIQHYIKSLKCNGTRAGLPYVRYIDNGIWELRPSKDRFMFFVVDGETIVFLSHFRKTTLKTPPREIKKAYKLKKDYIERSQGNE